LIDPVTNPAINPVMVITRQSTDNGHRDRRPTDAIHDD